MTMKRAYDDGCAMAHSLNLIGERWALLVIRELLFEPRRYSDLKESLIGISTNVLAQRLKDLEETGVIRRQHLPPPAASWVYELTPWGKQLEPIMQQLGRWGVQAPSHDPTRPLSISSLMSAQKTMFDSKKAGPFHGTIGLRIDTDYFVGRIRDGEFELRKEATLDVDATISGSTQAIGAALFGGVALRELEAAGELRVEGDHDLAQTYFTLFPLPAKIGQSENGGTA